jgi:6,7-dimethyl-8-ribityllumazine synthase
LSHIDKKRAKNILSFKGKDITIGLIVSQWHNDITSKMRIAAVDYLEKSGINKNSLIIKEVPGSFEIPLAAQWLIEKHEPAAVICLGCIIKGETSHNKYISHAVTEGIMALNLKYNIPLTFGVLTTDNVKQAKERAGGKHGNKGIEAAATALLMLNAKL